MKGLHLENTSIRNDFISIVIAAYQRQNFLQKKKIII